MRFSELKETNLYEASGYVSIFRLKNGRLELGRCNSWKEDGLYLYPIPEMEFRLYVKLEDELMELLESLRESYNYMTISEDGVLEVFECMPHIVDGILKQSCEDFKHARFLPNVETRSVDISHIGDFIAREKYRQGADL